MPVPSMGWANFLPPRSLRALVCPYQHYVETHLQPVSNESPWLSQQGQQQPHQLQQPHQPYQSQQPQQPQNQQLSQPHQQHKQPDEQSTTSFPFPTSSACTVPPQTKPKTLKSILRPSVCQTVSAMPIPLTSEGPNQSNATKWDDVINRQQFDQSYYCTLRQQNELTAALFSQHYINQNTNNNINDNNRNSCSNDINNSNNNNFSIYSNFPPNPPPPYQPKPQTNPKTVSKRKASMPQQQPQQLQQQQPQQHVQQPRQHQQQFMLGNTGLTNFNTVPKNLNCSRQQKIVKQQQMQPQPLQQPHQQQPQIIHTFNCNNSIFSNHRYKNCHSHINRNNNHNSHKSCVFKHLNRSVTINQIHHQSHNNCNNNNSVNNIHTIPLTMTKNNHFHLHHHPYYVIVICVMTIVTSLNTSQEDSPFVSARFRTIAL
ncbi:hypothetical protein HELRODRAFT_165656 [Helobdella robusta]|uniref:Uncharacterized protein n=1 Tax=Helobdella robusta TaxID=6412 RepID=T1EX49_HELRO|nr:hypothetical protein HELRODRAFT_165656 [Helobdella robusta]ESN91603.1 hypothetical protein HELRODRAFT_165656 [Helobdella robusta]